VGTVEEAGILKQELLQTQRVPVRGELDTCTCNAQLSVVKLGS